METNNQQQGKFGRWVKTSITARMLMVGVLIVVLMIPLSYIKNLIYERMIRQQEVVSEINQKWGEEVLIYGPILKVPYKTYSEKTITNPITKEVQKETITKIKYAYFFPKKLVINSTINPEEKTRGIYKTAVYKSSIAINGSFSKPDFSEIEINDEDILWDKTRVIIQSSNLKGAASLFEIQFHKNKYQLTSKNFKNTDSNIAYNTDYVDLNELESNNLQLLDVPNGKETSFAITKKMKGSKQIRFIPVGQETDVNINSDWKTANFIGEYLPHNSDKITEEGFNAKWKILDINRPFSQQYFNGIPNLNNYAFGVNFLIPVDEYQKNERSAKYGFLVIGLTFLIFFLIQSMSKINIHPFQYLMIGIALTMFYTLLISISEHSSYLKAYLIAGASVVTLITLYSKSILKNIKFPVFIGVSLTALYTFIFVIIQLENYALLVGSIGLFVILAAVMFASRKIDWENN
ncbi:cell envelope integrity protein CreD [Polaribacter sp. R2A056_3_33]|uniref:cell envelope integrity protein CreD n=1 Tax=Polaribacter sp. R2A056_3_33 TaxID=2745563 RepID=UPI001C4F12D1|nr:cell envelope integrity protein CreD [Polaribacter sp. R2A056_3_33]QXP70906.1 cell envelope integrity protein CreD [Polaribacter sp. R2A056_3_33]